MPVTIEGTGTINYNVWKSTAGVNRNAVLQVRYSALNTSVITTSITAYSDIESLTITPYYNTSRILMIANYGASGAGGIRFMRDSTVLTAGQTGGAAYMHWEANSQTQGNFDGGSLRTQFTLMFYDSPASTSLLTYKTQITAYDGSGTDGFGVGTAPGAYSGGLFSGFLLMEIAQ